jgi:hypothetical protein
MTRIIVLGTITVEDDKTVAFDIPASLDPDVIAAALVAAEEERIVAQARESRKLREMFLSKDEHADEC